MNYMDGWVSPIELIYENVKKQTDEFIMARCEASLGVKVDKDELIKAMHYDREQYKKGFANGYKQRGTKIVHCKDCKYRHTYDCPIGLWVEDNWFCYKGEQGENK